MNTYIRSGYTRWSTACGPRRRWVSTTATDGTSIPPKAAATARAGATNQTPFKRPTRRPTGPAAGSSPPTWMPRNWELRSTGRRRLPHPMGLVPACSTRSTVCVWRRVAEETSDATLRREKRALAGTRVSPRATAAVTRVGPRSPPRRCTGRALMTRRARGLKATKEGKGGTTRVRAREDTATAPTETTICGATARITGSPFRAARGGPWSPISQRWCLARLTEGSSTTNSTTARKRTRARVVVSTARATTSQPALANTKASRRTRYPRRSRPLPIRDPQEGSITGRCVTRATSVHGQVGRARPSRLLAWRRKTRR